MTIEDYCMIVLSVALIGASVLVRVYRKGLHRERIRADKAELALNALKNRVMEDKR